MTPLLDPPDKHVESLPRYDGLLSVVNATCTKLDVVTNRLWPPTVVAKA